VSLDTYLCPGCDKEVRVGAPYCPHCNPPSKRRKRQESKASAGKPKRSWEQGSSYDGLDLPDEDFDYDEYVAREFGRKPHRKIGIKWYWWVTAIVVIILATLAGFNFDYWGHSAWW